MTQPAGATQAPPKQGTGKQQAAPAPQLRPFFTGSLDLETHTYTRQFVANADQQPYDTYYPKTNGFLADMWIGISATGGSGTAGTLQTGVSIVDWLATIQVSDTGGQPVLGPMSGEELLLLVKWGGFSFSDDPRDSETYEEITTLGNGTAILQLPVQFVRSLPLGPLPNTNSNNAYQVDVTLAASSTIFSANPGTSLPTVAISIYQDAYRQSSGKDAQGNATVTTPPGLGAVLYAKRNTMDIQAGSFDEELSQQEGSYRAMLFILKDSAGSRTQGDADWPSPMQVYFNNDVPYDRVKAYWIRRMERDYGYVKTLTAGLAPVGGRDLGVFNLNWCTDGGTPQAVYEDRYKYLSVSAADTLGIRGVMGGAGNHKLATIYNFVRPPGGNIKGLTAR